MQIDDFSLAKYWVDYPKIMQIKSGSFISDRVLLLVLVIFAAKSILMLFIFICGDGVFYFNWASCRLTYHCQFLFNFKEMRTR